MAISERKASGLCRNQEDLLLVFICPNWTKSTDIPIVTRAHTHLPSLTHTHDGTVSDKPGTEDHPPLAQTDLCRAGFTAVAPFPSTGPLRALGFLPRLQRKQRSPGSLPSGPTVDILAEPTLARKSRLVGTSHVDIMHP